MAMHGAPALAPAPVTTTTAQVRHRRAILADVLGELAVAGRVAYQPRDIESPGWKDAKQNGRSNSNPQPCDSY